MTKPIERAISGVPRLQALQSTSANSLSLVIAQFQFGSDVKEIRATIEQNLQNAGLPNTVEPSVTALNINSAPVIIASIAATTDDGLDEAAQVAKDDIVPALLGIEGVATVDVSGGEEQRVLITIDPQKLTASGVTMAQVTGVLAANNLTFPSGSVSSDGSSIPVSTIGHIDSIQQVEDMVVGVKAPAPVIPDPNASTDPNATGRPARRPDPGHDRRPRHGRAQGRRDVRLRAHRRQARAVAVGHQDLERQHRPGRGRRHGEARRAGRAAQGHRLGHGRLGPVAVHQGVP